MPGLSADGGIDLGEQGGRHLDQAHPAPDDAGGEPGEVADDPAAERDDEVAAFEAGGEELAAEGFEAREGFGGFAGGDRYGRGE